MDIFLIVLSYYLTILLPNTVNKLEIVNSNG